MTNLEQALDIDDVAAIYKVRRRTVEGWIARGVGPASFKTPGGDRRFLPSAVRADLDQRGTRTSTEVAAETVTEAAA